MPTIGATTTTTTTTATTTVGTWKRPLLCVGPLSFHSTLMADRNAAPFSLRPLHAWVATQLHLHRLAHIVVLSPYCAGCLLRVACVYKLATVGSLCRVAGQFGVVRRAVWCNQFVVTFPPFGDVRGNRHNQHRCTNLMLCRPFCALLVMLQHRTTRLAGTSATSATRRKPAACS